MPAIGVATAKGLCYSLDKPMISVPTLKSMAFGIWQLTTDSKQSIAGKNILICPMIDARRMEVYCSLFDTGMNEVRETKAEVIEESSFSDLLTDHAIIFAGEGASKCKKTLEKNKNAIFPDDFQASAKYMVSFAEYKYANNVFENIAYFEPFYLKDFIAGKPRVKGLD